MKQGHCRLCRKLGGLCKSHIIPDSLYAPLFDEKSHKFILLSSVPGEPNKRFSSGFWEHLLCQECEGQIGEWENYAKGLIESAIQQADHAKDILMATGVDYAKIKLFQLSVLWRSSVSSHNYFSAVSLGPHEEKVRTLLLARNPGRSSDYPCVMALLEDDVLLHAPMTDAARQPKPSHIMVSPRSGRLEGARVYKFCFAGFGWVYSVGNAKAPKVIQECAAREDGRLFVRKCRLSVFFGKEHIQLFGDRGKLGRHT